MYWNYLNDVIKGILDAHKQDFSNRADCYIKSKTNRKSQLKLNYCTRRNNQEHLYC